MKVFTDVRSLPSFADAPAYAYAMTCRPYLRDVFGGYQLYLYVDADIRFEHEDAFDLYLGAAATRPTMIAISHEVDPAYAWVQNPPQATLYHAAKYNRMLRAFGQEVAEYMRYFNCFNAGVFAMHRDSRTWEAYRRTLELTMKGPFDHMAEQDALAVAIAGAVGSVPVRVAPATMNWLCSIAPPVYAQDLRRWVRPTFPQLPISVLHLTNSARPVTIEGRRATLYDVYKIQKLTA